MDAIHEPNALAALAESCPQVNGVYRLYRGPQLLHIGLAAGAATLRSELLAHAGGDYGAHTQAADRVEWEVAPDSVFAYQRFHALRSALMYVADAIDLGSDLLISASGRFTRAGAR